MLDTTKRECPNKTQRKLQNIMYIKVNNNSQQYGQLFYYVFNLTVLSLSLVLPFTDHS